ncbi:hypothetical protein AGOR_G00219740 [Albula goreensis]|uniref:Uncharacterized protein n=1 Tax=Albula goreensis TaxID=1534307 RepID=A0A8T3CS96_9TELE|nr:hypothetical protein AGOR_G00219740 [Albula goreensis]
MDRHDKDVEHRTAEESEDDGQDEEDEEDEAEDDEEEEEDEEEEKDTEAVQDQVEETETLPEQDDGYKVERNPQISGVIKEEMVVDGVKKLCFLSCRPVNWPLQHREESEAEQTNTPQTEVKADSNSRSENGTKEVKLRGLFGSNRKISLFKRSSTTEAKREGGTRGEEEKRATESPRSTGKSEVGAETTSSSDAEPQARGQQRAAGPGAPPSSRSATCNLL